MIIAVSDVHLGYDKCNYDAFCSFLDQCTKSKSKIDKIDDLVLLGDILDFWRCNNGRIVMDKRSTELFNKLRDLKEPRIHYVVGNHDYYMLRLYERYENECQKEQYEKGDNRIVSPLPFRVSRSLRLRDDAGTVYFMHGYQLDVLANLEPLDIESYEKLSDHMCFGFDVTSGIASYLWDIIHGRGIQKKFLDLEKEPHKREIVVNGKTIKIIDEIKKLANSKGAYILLGMKPDDKFVFGHTHDPFMDGTIANTGSWVNETSNEESQNTYVKISNGKMELKRFDEKNFP